MSLDMHEQSSLEQAPDSVQKLDASSLTELLYCHESMDDCTEPDGLEVTLLKGQCYLMLPEAFLECADAMSSEDWNLLCEMGLQFAQHDMEQCALHY